MNYSLEEFYNELYRIFSCNDELFTQTQVVLIGDCMRSLLAGENVIYKLERLRAATESIPKVSKLLEEYIHRYIRYTEQNAIDEDLDTDLGGTVYDYEKKYSQQRSHE